MRLTYNLVARAPGPALGRARTAGRLAPLFEAGFAALGRPLYGSITPVAHGPARGLRLLGERRSLAWISGRVEDDVQALLVRLLDAGDTFVDIGASIGFFSLLAARLVGPSGTVLAFEPQAAAAGSLRKNAELNGFDTITVVEAAVSSRSGEALLEGVGFATARLTEGDRGSRAAIRVSCVCLDDFLAGETSIAPDLVKIDVEGHEAAVLDGMRGTLASRRPALLVERHGDTRGVRRLLAEERYATTELGARGEVPDGSRLGHLLALPEERALP